MKGQSGYWSVPCAKAGRRAGRRGSGKGRRRGQKRTFEKNVFSPKVTLHGNEYKLWERAERLADTRTDPRAWSPGLPTFPGFCLYNMQFVD